MGQEGLQDFAIAFLSILLEGAPFILLGTVLSGFIDVFLPASALDRILPRNKFAAVLVCGALGLVLPVCECAVVPVIRRLVKKGLPLSCALTYMLAAPIVNPVTALSTFAAFSEQDPGLVTAARLGMGYLIAVAVGLFILKVPLPAVLKGSFLSSLKASRAAKEEKEGICCEGHEHGHEHEHGHGHEHAKGPNRVTLALQAALRDFVDVGVYFAIGVTITALFNISDLGGRIDQLATSPTGGPAVLMALAFLLSLCSTSDAFIAATLDKFSLAARLAFLVFGPMMDIKLLFLYQTVFRRPFILQLAAVLFLVTGALSLFVEWLIG